MLFQLKRFFLEDRSGATSVEYSLIAALVGVVIITAVKRLGTNVSQKFVNIANNIT